MIHETAIIYDNVQLGDNPTIHPYVILGSPDGPPLTIGNNAVIRPFTNIEGGSIIGDDFHCGERVLIRSNTNIGKKVSIGNLCDRQGDLDIGNYTRLHSNVHVGKYTVIKDFVWIFPYVVFTNDMYPPHGDLVGSVVEEYVLVGVQSTILPNLKLAKNSIIGANSLVTKNTGENELWLGSPAKFIKRIEDIRDEQGDPLYPWKDYLFEKRGYPWES